MTLSSARGTGPPSAHDKKNHDPSVVFCKRMKKLTPDTEVHSNEAKRIFRPFYHDSLKDYN
jgi:hypothetical protein